MAKDYFAFISYNSRDIEWGKRVQQKLEHYKVPDSVCTKYGLKRTPVKPVFFAPTDIQPGGLSDELKERLKASRNLIVLCSPNSAKSEWVGKEIRFFHELGRTNNIHFFIVDGVPHSGNEDTECFNPVVDELGLPEILGANVNEKIFRWSWLNRERAYVQLISKLLGIEFDDIWQRHKRLMLRRMLYLMLSLVVVVFVIAGVWITNVPVNVCVQLNEISVHNSDLPPLKNAIVTMSMENERKSDTINAMSSMVVFKNIPHKYKGRNVHFTVVCEDFINIDTVVPLSSNMVLDIRRNPNKYGDIHFKLWNPKTEKFLPNEKVIIDGIETQSDNDGMVIMTIPLDRQKLFYSVKTDYPLEDTLIAVPHSWSTGISIK